MRGIIATIEEISLNAWPSLQTILYDGWLLRFANGYTKRANSINVIGHSDLTIEEKLIFCEDLYSSKNLDVVFKIAPGISPANFDFILSEHGYRKDSLVSVQTMQLNSAFKVNHPTVIREDNLSLLWLDSFAHMNGLTDEKKITLEHMMHNIVPEHCFFSVVAEDRIVACGLGVLQSGYLGLFDIITDAGFRNRGFGKMLILNILNWGIQKGAHTAYLQVLLNNFNALHLYSAVGFIENYQYWYRIK